jgi:hypothetical protein
MSKQFNIKGANGLYLTYKPLITLTTGNYESQLIRDTDFFPKSTKDANLFNFKNARYQETGTIIGSNSQQKSNSIFKYSEISTNTQIIANKIYYNKFKFYFRFYGSTLSGYRLPGLSAANTKKILDRLRVKLYVVIGSNEVPMELSNLEKYTTSWTAVTTSDTTGSDDIAGAGNYGIQLATGLNSEDCIDMAYTGTTQMNTLFNGYLTAPDKYNFRVDASFPDFNQVATNNKNYKIIVKYFNIGVSGTGTYATSENVELMSNNFTYYSAVYVPPIA